LKNLHFLSQNSFNSKVEDLSWFEKTHCIYEVGRDRQGRPVIAFIGKWFPYEKANLVSKIDFSLEYI